MALFRGVLYERFHCIRTYVRIPYLCNYYCLFYLIDIKCLPLNAPRNGVSAMTEAGVGTVVEFMCNLDYELHGNRVIVCQNNAAWSGPVPKCVKLGIHSALYTNGCIII